MTKSARKPAPTRGKTLKDLPLKKDADKVKGGRIPTHANAIVKSPSR
jgi:hypothetical protein